jgi:nucleotide-binding universal stress UspA family protein
VKVAGDRLRELGVDCTGLVLEGDPASQILEAIEKQSADFLAIATHGRSGLTRWVLGSVTEKVLRAAKVPILVLRCSE